MTLYERCRILGLRRADPRDWRARLSSMVSVWFLGGLFLPGVTACAPKSFIEAKDRLYLGELSSRTVRSVVGPDISSASEETADRACCCPPHPRPPFCRCATQHGLTD